VVDHGETSGDAGVSYGVAREGVVGVLRSRRGPIGFWLGLAVVVLYPLISLLFKIRWRGREHIPASGGVLIVVNHVSYVDPLVFCRFVWDAGRIPRFLAKDSLFRIFFVRSVLRGAGQIPVSRGTADAQQSLQRAVEALEDGEAVCIYPEGTVTRDPDFWPMVGHTGVARLALTVDVYRKRYRLLPRKTVQCLAGPAVDLSAYRDRPLSADLLREVTDVIMRAIRDQLAELRGETPPADFFRRPVQREAS
jgi:1-acyl-sn-glycerol-3-phosphate acyltransferase